MRINMTPHKFLILNCAQAPHSDEVLISQASPKAPALRYLFEEMNLRQTLLLPLTSSILKMEYLFTFEAYVTFPDLTLTSLPWLETI